jgi:hypothetical protein
MRSDCRTCAVLKNGTRLALLRVEVLPMHIPSSLKLTVLGLAFSSMAFAQRSSPIPPAGAVNAPAVPLPTSQLPVVTQSSRVRAFNADPSGEVRSLYLQNGIVVDLTPALGGQVGPAVRKGQQITVIGTKSEINGQSLIEAASVRLNDQTFSANVAAGPAALAEGAVPTPPSPRRRNKAAAPAPCGVSVDTPPPPPDFGGPPPPPDGMAPPPPPDGMAPPPQN